MANKRWLFIIHGSLPKTLEAPPVSSPMQTFVCVHRKQLQYKKVVVSSWLGIFAKKNKHAKWLSADSKCWHQPLIVVTVFENECINATWRTVTAIASFGKMKLRTHRWIPPNFGCQGISAAKTKKSRCSSFVKQTAVGVTAFQTWKVL